MKLNKKLTSLVLATLIIASGQIYASDSIKEDQEKENVKNIDVQLALPEYYDNMKVNYNLYDYMNDVDLEFVDLPEELKERAKEAFEQNKKLIEQYDKLINLGVEFDDNKIEEAAKSLSKVATSAQDDFRRNIPQQRDTEVWKKNNFLDMRLALEKLTNTEVISEGPYGILYTTYGSDIYGGDWENRSSKWIDYLWGVGNKYMEKWMNDANNKQELAKIASMSFKDIKGTEWYASHIPTAVYYGLINGYPDGTFKGSAPVSRAEFAVMMKNASRSFTENVGGASRLTAHKDQWYYKDMGGISGGPMGIFGLSVNDMNSGMSRGEVAMVLARAFFIEDFNAEYQKVSTSSFKDISKITKAVAPMWIEELNDKGAREEYMKQLKTPNSCPKDVVAALNVLKSKGLMAGDENGNSNWTKTVTRGEAIALFERCAQQVK